MPLTSHHRLENRKPRQSPETKATVSNCQALWPLVTMPASESAAPPRALEILWHSYNKEREGLIVVVLPATQAQELHSDSAQMPRSIWVDIKTTRFQHTCRFE